MRMHVFVPRRAAKRTRQLSGTPPTRRPPPPNVPSRAPAPRAQVVPLRYRKFADLYGAFPVKSCFGLIVTSLFGAGKGLLRPVACDQVPGSARKVSRDRNA